MVLIFFPSQITDENFSCRRTNVSILRVMLSKIGHTVFTARDGVEAIAVLKWEPVDVVLTDWMMPNLDGLGLIRWIRSEMQHRPVIIVITALRSNDAEAQALGAGADAYLVKPISTAQIGTLIHDIDENRLQGMDKKHVPQKSQNNVTLGLENKVLPLEKIGGELLETPGKIPESGSSRTLTPNTGSDK